MIVLRESDKIFEGQLNIDGLIGVSRFKLGRNSKIECEPRAQMSYRLLFW